METIESVAREVSRVSADFAEHTLERQQRRELDAEDFRRLKAAGFLLTGVPAEQGGLWSGPAGSARAYAGLVRSIAHGDPSVALVAAMHPAVTSFFLAVESVDDAPDAWRTQRQAVIDSAREQWWGTVTSEPGSGGDLLKTKTSARPDGDRFLITGDKHFGSGSGHADWMITSAKVEGSDAPELFWLQHREAPWDGSTGCRLTVPWNGMGMCATQSHAFRFEDYPAQKAASSEILARCAPITSQVNNLLFTGVILGVADNALAFARRKMDGRLDDLRPFEAVEWTRCRNELWLAEQAFAGALASIEASEPDAHFTAIRAKVCAAELVETALARMAKVVGGASYSKAMPLAQWVEDVKALGFLRPPLPLAYDNLLSAP